MDEKIEAVARALCKFYGKDPDQKTQLPGRRVGFQSYVGEGPLDGPPLWEAYKEEAEKYVVVVEAVAPFFGAAEAKRW